ncbi:MAG: substrate-binding domain-containing protein [Vicinamibacterales bacterium]
MNAASRALPPPSRRVGIKDIARALGISTGTVDRALHAKPGINHMTRARVLSMAESLGYRPNLAARQLKSPRAWKLSVHLPREIALFWDALRDGIREGAAPFEAVVDVEFRSYPGLGDGDIPLFEQALAGGTDGIIVAPGDPAALRPWIRRAAKKKVPVVCVVTDAPGTERLTSVSADPFTVGAVAGELIGRCLPSGGRVAFFTGWLATQDHSEKLRGFRQSLRISGKGAEIAQVVEAHDDPRAGYGRALSLLKDRRDTKGIYVSTVNSLPVLEALAHVGLLGSVAVVTTDLFPELVPYIRQGSVAATVYQRPLTQGQMAVRSLVEFLQNGTVPPPTIKVIPHLVMRSNLDLFLERLRMDAGAPGREEGARRRLAGKTASPGPTSRHREGRRAAESTY